MIKNSFYYNDNNIYDYKISNKQIEMEKMNNKIKKEWRNVKLNFICFQSKNYLF